MKVKIANEEWQHLDTAIIRGACEGLLASFAIPGFYLLHRRSAWYRSLLLPLRTAGVVIVVAPFTSIQTERRSIEFDWRQW